MAAAAGLVLYSTGDAVKGTGVSVRNLDYWVRIGLVVPTIEAEGTGTIRGYTFDDLVLLKICGMLSESGVEFRRALLAKVRDYLSSPAVRAGQIDKWVHIHISKYYEVVLYVESIRRDLRETLRRAA